MQTTALMQNYVGTVNQSIGQNRDRFPYKQMIDVSKPLTEGLKMQVGVYKDDPKQVHDFFTLKWTGSELEFAGHGKDESTDVAWKVPTSHLQEVVDDPAPYVREPAKLDLDWLGKRIGIA